MEKRVLLAVFLSFLVLFVYQLLFAPEPRREEPQTADVTSEPEEAQGPVAPTAPPPPAPTVVEVETPEPVIAGNAERDIVVETANVLAVFSTRGAELRSWRLKHYLDARQEPLELIATPLPPDTPKPFTLRVPDADVSAILRQAVYRASADRVDATRGPADLTFEYRDAAGLAVRKQFRFNPDGQAYVVEVDAHVEQAGNPIDTIVEWGPGLGPDLTEESGGGFVYRQDAQGILYRDGDVSRLAPSDLREAPTDEGRFGFVGIDDHYFISVAVRPADSMRVEYRPVDFVTQSGGNEARTLVAYSLGASGDPVSARFFIGPKEFDVLASVDRDLVRAIHFGIFSVIIVPLLRALKWVYGYAGNYGWAIIILTLAINAVMFPLRHKSVVSMRKMQELQPEVKAIQDRYAKLKMSDPERQKMNVELMNLYRERGANPLGGCLPMVFMMPVLFSFYSMLSVAIEIRGAPFIGWIRDLSVHDPLYVTPLLMGASMLWQQKITPTPTMGDPTQQKIMRYMPVMFTFFFLWAPSGLVLYWLVSNLWAIGQQQVTNRIIGPPKVRARPPAERRVKRGRSETPQAARQG